MRTTVLLQAAQFSLQERALGLEFGLGLGGRAAVVTLRAWRSDLFAGAGKGQLRYYSETIGSNHLIQGENNSNPHRQHHDRGTTTVQAKHVQMDGRNCAFGKQLMACS